MRSGRPIKNRELTTTMRRRLIVWFRECGESYTEIGTRFDLQRQRIGAILKATRPDLCGRIRPN